MKVTHVCSEKRIKNNVYNYMIYNDKTIYFENQPVIQKHAEAYKDRELDVPLSIVQKAILMSRIKGREGAGHTRGIRTPTPIP